MLCCYRVMDNSVVINERVQKLQQIKLLLSNTNHKLMLLAKNFNWNYKNLSQEEPSFMVTCSINPQHRVPRSRVKSHEEKCSWRHEGYTDNENTFPEYCGVGSCITLTPESLHLITKTVPSLTEKKCFRAVPQTSANFDQNFDREEKLAIYDYVIENTKRQVSYTDLWLQPAEKSEEKKEMAAWEIAAAERDAKRRRASYRNKVHTNRKTHTEILREVIETQMEAFKEETTEEAKIEKYKSCNRKSTSKCKDSVCKRKYDESPVRRSKEDRDKRRNHDKLSKHREHKRYPSDSRGDTKTRSRSHDKYRKWKTYEGRSHSHRSSRVHTRW